MATIEYFPCATTAKKRPCDSDSDSDDDLEEEDKSIVYIEGVNRDYSGQRVDIGENVWFAMKPPKHLGSHGEPLISARKLEIVRAQLTGKVKVKEVQEQRKEEAVDPASRPKEPVPICKRKSTVRFLNTSAEEHSF